MVSNITISIKLYTNQDIMRMIIEFIVDRYLILLKKRYKSLRKSTRKEIMFEFEFLG